MSNWLSGCYYHIESHDYYIHHHKHYLPLVESSAHSTILSTTSRTVLTQTFKNPSETDALKSVIYTFPLYDGVSVVSFTCKIGEKVLKGIVKEKFKAKKIFDDAVARGETAGLLVQAPEASDVFSTKLGNIPAGESIIVEITYLGELKHTETEGIRFTIPTSIAPRYGNGPATTYTHTPKCRSQQDGIKITVDVKMPEGSNIKGVQSPSHPISVSLGTLSTAKNDDPSLSKASATLSLESAALEKDFVLIVSAKDVGVPKAFLETHPTIPNHRALMATLVPKFALPPSKPEIVFVADRSGSMSGYIDTLVSAMNVFLKSLPSGVKFNICSFGSSYSFLWKQSKTYSADTLAEATKHLKTFSANMGGTETFSAIKATIDARYKDLPLELILLTDGDIWAQNELFDYVNQQVEESKGKIRIFPLGIGNGVSHALIEGLARAGNGFASTVQHGERLDSSVVRMLRGALSPHINDYSLEVKYEQEDDDFEVIEKVTEGFKVLLADDADEKPAAPKPTISLFDSKVNPEKEDIKGEDSADAVLPVVPSPNLYQAPHKIPSLFAFSRTTVYLLMSPETIQRNPTSVILKATSEHGPLSLEIPVEALPEPGTTIHQLAAKKAVQDLEEGRGWIYDAKDQKGKLVKERFPSRFQDLVEREAVRLGEKYQIAGKWTSFVAVEANDKEGEARRDKEESEGNAVSQQPPAYNAYGGYTAVGGGNSMGSWYAPSSPAAYGYASAFGYSSPQFTPLSPMYSPASPGYSPTSPTGFAAPAGASYEPTSPDYDPAGCSYEPTSPYYNPAGTSYTPASPIYALESSIAESGNATYKSESFTNQYDPTIEDSAMSFQLSAPQELSSSTDVLQDFDFDSFLANDRSEAANFAFDTADLDFNDRSPVPSNSFRLMSSTSPPLSRSMRRSAAPGGSDVRASYGGISISLERGEKLDGMVERTEDLSKASAEFTKGAKKSRSVNPFSGASSAIGGLFGSKSSSSASSPPPPPPSAPAPAPLASSAPKYKEVTAERRGVSQSSPVFAKSAVRYDAPASFFSPSSSSSRSRSPAKDWSSKTIVERLHGLIALQGFDGSWDASAELSAILGFALGSAPAGVDAKVWATLIVIATLEEKLADEEGTWGLVVDKAKDWLGAQTSVPQGTEAEAGKVVESGWKA